MMPQASARRRELPTRTTSRHMDVEQVEMDLAHAAVNAMFYCKNCKAEKSWRGYPIR